MFYFWINLSFWDSVKHCMKVHILPSSQFIVQTRFLKNYSECISDCVLITQVVSIHLYTSFSFIKHCCENFDGSRFPCSIWSQKSKDFSPFYVKCYSFHSFKISVFFLQIFYFYYIVRFSWHNIFEKINSNLFHNKKIATFFKRQFLCKNKYYLYFSFNLAIFSAFSLALAASRSALISSLVFTTSLTSSFSSSFLAFLSTSAIILTTTSLLRSL